jgi:thiol-disulfide isomerase/thioredoxin
MGKAERNRRQSAQEKIAAQRAAAQRAERRRQGLIFGGSLIVVVAIVVAFIVIKVAGGGNSPAQAGSSSPSGTTLPASVIKDVTTVPAATLDAVGPGNTYKSAIQKISNGTPLTSGGKPQMVYVGAEYCPFCAAERWAMTTALSRFGTFTGLRGIHSSSTDTDPNTPTLTFYKASYTSKYLVFSHTEAQTVTRANLEPVGALQNQLMSKYDVPPYVPSAQYDGSFPFIDFGNQYLINGASFDPKVLAGKSWAQVAAALKDPSSPIAKSADGAANLITAAICKITKQAPASVCNSAGVRAASTVIG